MPESLNEPEAVVIIDEPGNGTPGLFDGFKAIKIKDLFLKGSIEALDDPIALGTSYEGR